MLGRSDQVVGWGCCRKRGCPSLLLILLLYTGRSRRLDMPLENNKVRFPFLQHTISKPRVLNFLLLVLPHYRRCSNQLVEFAVHDTLLELSACMHAYDIWFRDFG